MRKLLSGVALCALATFTAACGGDENPGTSSPVTTVPAPAPMPTPTPTPTPSPTPTPTPTSYVSPCDLTRDQTVSLLFGTEVLAKGAFTSVSDYQYASASTSVVDVGTASSLRFDAASRNATLVRNGTTLAAFTGAQLDEQSEGIASYTSGANGLAFGCIQARLALTYTLVAAYAVNSPDPAPGATDTSRLLLIGGAPTASSGELSSGSYSSGVALGVLFTGTPNRQDATDANTLTAITFDTSSGVLKGTLTSNGDKSYTIGFTATLTPGTTRFQGNATTPSGATGKLSGGFFGPGGSEYGFVLAIDDGNAHITGVAFGKR